MMSADVLDFLFLRTFSAGTNPASASMAGMKVIVIKTEDNGNIDLTDLREKVKQPLITCNHL